MPAGRYETPVGGAVELSAQGRLSLAGTPFLAGAALPLKDGVAHLVHGLGLPLSDALKLATVNPGRFANGRGAFHVGAPADLIRFHLSHTLALDTILVRGEPIA
jgi:N-acetylglucosamine-6-phosphate deacetylase